MPLFNDRLLSLSLRRPDALPRTRTPLEQHLGNRSSPHRNAKFCPLQPTTLAFAARIPCPQDLADWSGLVSLFEAATALFAATATLANRPLVSEESSYKAASCDDIIQPQSVMINFHLHSSQISNSKMVRDPPKTPRRHKSTQTFGCDYE